MFLLIAKVVCAHGRKNTEVLSVPCSVHSKDRRLCSHFQLYLSNVNTHTWLIQKGIYNSFFLSQLLFHNYQTQQEERGRWMEDLGVFRMSKRKQRVCGALLQLPRSRPPSAGEGSPRTRSSAVGLAGSFTRNPSEMAFVLTQAQSYQRSGWISDGRRAQKRGPRSTDPRDASAKLKLLWDKTGTVLTETAELQGRAAGAEAAPAALPLLEGLGMHSCSAVIFSRVSWSPP